ncbi:hypothetical protein BDD12DRAFT_820734 [Trichophaea hybrida]|nr:hypothetical protein BDD12DRAFT_820734 [Trichophaea hybrida]
MPAIAPADKISLVGWTTGVGDGLGVALIEGGGDCFGSRVIVGIGPFLGFVSSAYSANDGFVM